MKWNEKKENTSTPFKPLSNRSLLQTGCRKKTFAAIATKKAHTIT